MPAPTAAVISRTCQAEELLEIRRTSPTNAWTGRDQWVRSRRPTYCSVAGSPVCQGRGWRRLDGGTQDESPSHSRVVTLRGAGARCRRQDQNGGGR
jgi:hypothetical protein